MLTVDNTGIQGWEVGTDIFHYGFKIPFGTLRVAGPGSLNPFMESQRVACLKPHALWWCFACTAHKLHKESIFLLLSTSIFIFIFNLSMRFVLVKPLSMLIWVFFNGHVHCQKPAVTNIGTVFYYSLVTGRVSKAAIKAAVGC